MHATYMLTCKGTKNYLVTRFYGHCSLQLHVYKQFEVSFLSSPHQMFCVTYLQNPCQTIENIGPPRKKNKGKKGAMNHSL